MENLQIEKNKNNSAIEIFYDFPVLCTNWTTSFLHPGRFADINILQNDGRKIKFTSLTGLHGIIAECQKDDYGIIAVPIVKSFNTLNGQKFYFAPLYKKGVILQNKIINNKNANQLLNKMIKDKIIMKSILNYINQFGDFKHLDNDEIKNIKRFIGKFNNNKTDFINYEK